MVSSIQTACPPPINIKADMQNQLSVFGLSLQTDRVRRSPSINQLDADPEESSLEISQIIDNPGLLNLPAHLSCGLPGVMLIPSLLSRMPVPIL